MKYILFIFFPYLYLFLLCGLNPLNISCIFYNFQNETSSNDDLKCSYLVTDKDIKENKTIFNNKNI